MLDIIKKESIIKIESRKKSDTRKGVYKLVNVLKLKGKMVEKKINAEELAKRIGMDRATFYRRLSKSDDFTIKEVDSIVRELGLTMDETNAIFFADFVA